jgi:hypothetical protein
VSNRSAVFDKWWPLPRSLDLVLGPVEAVADAMLAEVSRFLQGQPLSSGWVQTPSLDSMFGSINWFTNVPTVFYILPTRSAWTVLWNNSYLCDGYDSLCWNLTRNHGLQTMHWISSDEDSTMQAGTSFTFRSGSGEAMVERSVYCGRNDRRWIFEAYGEPLPEEDLAGYTSRRTRDRLNEKRLMALLESLGSRPWDETFYALGDYKAFRVERTSYPTSISRKQFAEIVRPPTGGH